MIGLDPYLVVRAGAVYVTVALSAAVWVWRRPNARLLSSATLAWLWTLPTVLALHAAVTRLGWWRFDAHGGLLLGMPVDFFLAWSWLWGPLLAVAFPDLPVLAIASIAFAADLVLMPNAAPVIQFNSHWLVGEAIGVSVAVVPGQLLARWTLRGERLNARASLQMMAFTGLVGFVIPAIAVEGSGTSIVNPLARPAWQLSLIVQLLALPAIVGVSAVQEFVTRGGGTPIPFDPPRRLVTSGIYSYVANPMQLSGVALLMLLGAALQNVWVAAAGVIAHFYSFGIAGWDEDEDLRSRFGGQWIEYRRHVRRWIPSRRPWHAPDRPPSRLFVAERCDMCRDVAGWFERRGASGLIIVAAESHPSRALTRITYEPSDGSRSASGIEAVARALEHLHLGWAVVGCVLRLPIINQLVQLLADASGAEPRDTSRLKPRSEWTG